MKKVTAYFLAPVDEVQRYLNEGWQPWGPPMYLGLNMQNYTVARQAMVKYEESQIQDMGPK